MKWLIASDIHGSAHYCQKLIDRFSAERADRLILLGDLLYHGPRNSLPDKYDTTSVMGMLNSLGERILCVRGNCDTEVDQMVLDFPMLADYAVMELNGHLMFITHGHLYNDDSLPPLCDGDILLHGHTHIPCCANRGKYIYMNPGSVSIPKGNSKNGYMTLENGIFEWKDIDGMLIAPQFDYFNYPVKRG